MSSSSSAHIDKKRKTSKNEKKSADEVKTEVGESSSAATSAAEQETETGRSAKTVRGRARTCRLDGCDRPAQSGGPWYCSIEHYRKDTPTEEQRICSCPDCHNVVMKGTKCQSHVTRRTGVVAERREFGDRRLKENRDKKGKKIAK